MTAAIPNILNSNKQHKLYGKRYRRGQDRGTVNRAHADPVMTAMGRNTTILPDTTGVMFTRPVVTVAVRAVQRARENTYGAYSDREGRRPPEQLPFDMFGKHVPFYRSGRTMNS